MIDKCSCFSSPEFELRSTNYELRVEMTAGILDKLVYFLFEGGGEVSNDGPVTFGQELFEFCFEV